MRDVDRPATPDATDVWLVGASVHETKVSTRERLTLATGEVAPWLRGLVNGSRAVVEAFVLSTCHRFEVVRGRWD